MADEQKPEQLKGRASIQAGSYLPGEGYQATPSQKAAAGPQPEPTTVKMDVLRDGSFNGDYYHVGDSADVPDEYVDQLAMSGFAARADRAERAQEIRDQAAKDQADADVKAAKRGGRRSTAVSAMGTRDMPGAEPPKQE